MRYFQLYFVSASLSLRKEDERSVSFTVQRLTTGIEEQQVCELITESFSLSLCLRGECAQGGLS